jgi:hypothetical protein
MVPCLEKRRPLLLYYSKQPPFSQEHGQSNYQFVEDKFFKLPTLGRFLGIDEEHKRTVGERNMLSNQLNQKHL